MTDPLDVWKGLLLAACIGGSLWIVGYVLVRVVAG